MPTRAALHAVRTLLAVPVACFLLAPPASATRLFRTDYSTYPGLTPTSGSGYHAAVADVDGDGRDDLLTLRQYSSPFMSVILEVRRGAPGGELSPLLAAYPTGLQQDMSAYPRPADVDGNGTVDLMVTALDTVAILPGVGGGAFGAPVLISVPGCLEGGIAAGDFNEDGDKDLVVVESASSARIFWGAGGMVFSSGPSLSTRPGAEFVLVGLVNGDAHLDIVVGASVASAVFLGDGAGNFTASEVPVARVRILADLEGDGALDVVGISAAALGLGDGSFAAAIAHSIEDPWVAADFDEDGRLDLAGVGTTNVRLIRTQQGLGGGAFGPVTEYSNNPSCFTLASGDMDGDGHADLVTSTFTNSYGLVLHGTGTALLEQAPYFVAGMVPGTVTAGHMNGDAWPDLVIANSTAASLSVLHSTGPASYAAPQVLVQPSGQAIVRLGDLNADGRDDVVTSNGTTIIRVNLTQPSGLPQFTAAVILPGNATRLQLADMNADGKRDVLYAWASGAGIALGDGLGGFGAPTDLGFSLGGDLQAADLNGDSWADIVGTSGLSPRVCIASAPGVFPTFTDLAALPASPGAIRIGRLDADANPDLLIQASGLQSYKGTGGGAFGPRVAIATTPATLAHWLDLNGDGLDDVVSAPVAFSSFVSVNDGASAFLPARGFGNVTGFTGVGFADVDGNGRSDMIALVSSNFLPSAPQRVVLHLNQTVTPNVGVAPHPALSARLVVRAWPNPSPGVIRLTLAGSASHSVRVTLLDVAGRVVESRRFAPGTSELAIGRPDLGAGLYFARVERGGESAMTRACVVR